MTPIGEDKRHDDSVQESTETSGQNLECFMLSENVFERERHLEVQDKPVKQIFNLGGEYTVVLYDGTGVVSIYDKGGKLEKGVDIEVSIDVDVDVDVANQTLLEWSKNSKTRNKVDIYNGWFSIKHLFIDLNVPKKYWHKFNKTFERLNNLTFPDSYSSQARGGGWSYVNAYATKFSNLDSNLKIGNLFKKKKSYSEKHDWGLISFSRYNFYVEAVLVITVDEQGNSLPTSQWKIHKFESKKEYEKAKPSLPARAVSAFDSRMAGSQATEEILMESDKWKVSRQSGKLVFGTKENGGSQTLDVLCVNNCYMAYPQNPNIFAVLTENNEVAIVDTTQGTIPKRWLVNSIKLPENVDWFRLDPKGNYIIFSSGNAVKVFNIENGKIEQEFDSIQGRFDIDPAGNILVGDDQGRPRMIKTNFLSITNQAEREKVEENRQKLEALLGGDVFAGVPDDVQSVAKKKETTQESPYKKWQERILNQFKSRIDSANTDEDITDLVNKLHQLRQSIEKNLAETEPLSCVKIAHEIVKPTREALFSKEEDLKVKSIYSAVIRVRDQIKQITNLEGIVSAKEEVDQMATDLKGISRERHESDKDKMLRELQEELKRKMNEYLKVDNEKLFEDLKLHKDRVFTKIGDIQLLGDLNDFQDEDPEYNSLLEFVRSSEIKRRIPIDHEISENRIRADVVSALKKRKQELTKEEREREAKAAQELKKRLKTIGESIDFFIDGVESVQELEDRNLEKKKSYQRLLRDIAELPEQEQERKIRYLEDRIREKRREINQEFSRFTGELSFLKNDPDLYFEESRHHKKVIWSPEYEISEDKVSIGLKSNTGKHINISDRRMLESDSAYEINKSEYRKFKSHLQKFAKLSHRELGVLRSAILHGDFDEKSLNSSLNDETKRLLKQIRKKELSELEQKAIKIAGILKKRNGVDKRDVPVLNEHYVYTDRVKNDLKKAALFLKMQLKSGKGMLLFEGDTGTGKDFLLDILLAETNRELFAFDCSKWTEISDATYSFEFDGKTIKVPSIVIQALETAGSCLYFNEFNTLSEDMVKFFNALLSHRRTITTTDGKKVKAHPRVVITGSMNARKGYKGIKQLSPDAKGRIDYITVDYPPEKMTEDEMNKQEDTRNLKIQDIATDILNTEGIESISSNVGKAEKIAKSILELIILSKPETEEEKEILQTQVINAIDGNRGSAENLYSPEEAMMVYRNVDVLKDLSQSEFKDLWNTVVNQQTPQEQKIKDIQADRNLFNKVETSLLSILMFIKAANIARTKFRESQQGLSDEILDFIMSTREVDRCATVLDLAV